MLDFPRESVKFFMNCATQCDLRPIMQNYSITDIKSEGLSLKHIICGSRKYLNPCTTEGLELKAIGNSQGKGELTEFTDCTLNIFFFQKIFFFKSLLQKLPLVQRKNLLIGGYNWLPNQYMIY